VPVCARKKGENKKFTDSALDYHVVLTNTFYHTQMSCASSKMQDISIKTSYMGLGSAGCDTTEMLVLTQMPIVHAEEQSPY